MASSVLLLPSVWQQMVQQQQPEPLLRQRTWLRQPLGQLERPEREHRLRTTDLLLQLEQLHVCLWWRPLLLERGLGGVHLGLTLELASVCPSRSMLKTA